MGRIRAELLNHSLMRTVPCCLCGSEWEELLVGVALVVGPAVAGDLCPRCLSREPAAAAARLRALMRELVDHDASRRDRPKAIDAERLVDRIARLSQDFEHLRSLSRRICALSAELRAASRQARQARAELRAALFPTSKTSRRPDTGPELQGDAAPRSPGAAAEFGDLLTLAEELAGMGQWGLTVRQVIEAERVFFRRRHGWLDELSVGRVIDARYRDFLSVSA